MALTISQQVDRFIEDTDIAHMIIHGDIHTTVRTEGGLVRSFAKVLYDVQNSITEDSNSLLAQVQELISQIQVLPEEEGPFWARGGYWAAVGDGAQVGSVLKKTLNGVSFQELGTASNRDVPTEGDASNVQVVLGSDSRLGDAREPLSHTHPLNDIVGGGGFGVYIPEVEEDSIVVKLIMPRDTVVTENTPVFSLATLAPQGGPAVFEVMLNSVLVGTITFPTGSTTGSWTFSQANSGVAGAAYTISCVSSNNISGVSITLGGV